MIIQQEKSTPRRTHFQQEILFETTTQSNHDAFDNLSLDEQTNNDDENRPFYLERCENGLNPTLITDVDDLDIQRASPYAFHFINENLELHRDLFTVENDDEDEGNLRNQIKGN